MTNNSKHINSFSPKFFSCHINIFLHQFKQIIQKKKPYQSIINSLLIFSHQFSHELNTNQISILIIKSKRKKMKLKRNVCTCLREEITTEAPSKPSLSAMLKPIPCVEAVTIATFPLNLFGISISTLNLTHARAFRLFLKLRKEE